jgi:Icc-related predicted phosphoesterase
LPTRVCYTSDLHGDVQLYEQLGDLLRAQRPNLVLLGGDLVRDVDRNAPVLPQVARMTQEFIHHVASWCAADPQLTVACIAGNHEIVPVRDAFQDHHDRGDFVLLDPGRSWQYAGFAWLGYPCTPPSPHWAKDFERRDMPADPAPAFEGVEWDAVAQDLRPVDLDEYFVRQLVIAAELEQAIPAANPWILVAHGPPHDTNLDHLPHVPYPIGSRAVRRFIEQRQPYLALHGHVHESPQITGSYIDRLGGTLCIQPGQALGRLHAVLFDLDRPGETLRHTVFA